MGVSVLGWNLLVGHAIRVSDSDLEKLEQQVGYMAEQENIIIDLHRERSIQKSRLTQKNR
jgi:hypothetical protein